MTPAEMRDRLLDISGELKACREALRQANLLEDERARELRVATETREARERDLGAKQQEVRDLAATMSQAALSLLEEPTIPAEPDPFAQFGEPAPEQQAAE